MFSSPRDAPALFISLRRNGKSNLIMIMIIMIKPSFILQIIIILPTAIVGHQAHSPGEPGEPLGQEADGVSIKTVGICIFMNGSNVKIRV